MRPASNHRAISMRRGSAASQSSSAAGRSARDPAAIDGAGVMLRSSRTDDQSPRRDRAVKRRRASYHLDEGLMRIAGSVFSASEGTDNGML